MKRLLLTFFAGFAALFAHGQINSTSFRSAVTIAAGDGPIQCAVVDLDGDNRRELVVANHFDSRLLVYGNISTSGVVSAQMFRSPISFATGSMPHEMAVGDIDGDGRPDVVTGNLGDHTVSLFRNMTATGGSFQFQRIDIPAAGRLPHGVALSDIDSDGRLDLLVACHDSDSISLFRNMGFGVSTSTFPRALVMHIGDGPHIITAGDLTGDGRPEIAVGNYQTPDTRILWYVPGPTAEVGPFRTNNFTEIMRL